MATPDACLKPFSWGKVSARAADVLIIASGPSLREIDLFHLNGQIEHGSAYVIVVNTAILWIRKPHAFFTLDPSKRNVDAMRRQKRETQYFAAVPPDFGTPHARKPPHRVQAPYGVTYLRRIEGDGKLGAKTKLSDDPAAIHTGNSAWGALGLAFHLQPERIAILGLDGTQDEYAYGSGRPVGSLSHLPGLFASALPQLAGRRINVVNGSPKSRIECFSKMSPGGALNWIMA